MIKIKLSSIIFLIAIAIVGCTKSKADKPFIYVPAPLVDSGWAFAATPSWSEEFDYTGKPDSTKWGYDIGGSGWGNNEKEYYTNSLENASVANGVLTISALKKSVQGMNYTSARLVTANKFDFLYGRIEVKAKLPSGTGMWPAIWVLPTDFAYGDWPNSGEFDIMEEVGYDPNVIHVSAHTQKYNFKQNNQKTKTVTIDSAELKFHTYRMDWTPYAIRGYVDDQLILTYVNEGIGFTSWPFDKRFHLLLNIAVGGDWGGINGIDDNAFPATMQVDYVRYYSMLPK